MNFEPVFRRLNRLCVCDKCHTAHVIESLSQPCAECGGHHRRIRLFADEFIHSASRRQIVLLPGAESLHERLLRSARCVYSESREGRRALHGTFCRTAKEDAELFRIRACTRSLAFLNDLFPGGSASLHLGTGDTSGPHSIKEARRHTACSTWNARPIQLLLIRAKLLRVLRCCGRVRELSEMFAGRVVRLHGLRVFHDPAIVANGWNQNLGAVFVDGNRAHCARDGALVRGAALGGCKVALLFRGAFFSRWSNCSSPSRPPRFAASDRLRP